MPEFIAVARCDEVPEGNGIAVELDGRKIALFNVGGRFYAIANECRHMGVPLSAGRVYGTRVVCPLHGWEYDLATGCNVDDRSLKLRCFAVKIEADAVLIEV